MQEPDAQKKENENEEPLQDLTPEDDVTGGAKQAKVFGGLGGSNPMIDAQKKEIGDEV